jgi:hypothetical protein
MASNLILPSGEDRSDIEAVQNLPVFEIREEHPLAAIETVTGPADQHEAFITTAETIPEIVDSDQTIVGTIKVQESVVQDMLDPSPEIVVQDMLDPSPEIIASIQEEQASPMAEIPPTLTTLDEHPAPKAETALAPMELIASQEDLQPTIEMAQLIPAEDRQTTDNEFTNTVEEAKADETKDDTKEFSFPEVEATPTVQIRSKRGSRKRKTKPSA